MHEALISGFNVLYLFGDSNLNKGLETAMAVCASEADVPFAVHGTGPGVLALSSDVRSALLKSKAAAPGGLHISRHLVGVGGHINMED